MQLDLVDRQAEEIDMLREKVRQLEDLLVPPSTIIPIEWGLTASEAKLFAFLTTRHMATKANIMHALYSDRAGDDPEMKIVDVFICKVRKKLTPHGVEIITFWGQGYGLKNREAYAAPVAA